MWREKGPTVKNFVSHTKEFGVFLGKGELLKDS